MIYRTKQTKNYTTLPNSLLQDSRISPGAKGVLVSLLSRPESWEIKNAELCKEMQVSRYVLLSYLKELENVGYMKRYRTNRKGKGGIKWVRDVYDKPILKSLKSIPSITRTSYKEQNTTNKVQNNNNSPSESIVPILPEEIPFDLNNAPPKSVITRFVEAVILAGHSKSRAYGTFNRAVKDYGDEPTAYAAEKTLEANPLDPLAYFTATLKSQFDQSAKADPYQQAKQRIASRHQNSYRNAFAAYVSGRKGDKTSALAAFDRISNVPSLGVGTAKASVLHTVCKCRETDDPIEFFTQTAMNGNAWAAAGRYL